MASLGEAREFIETGLTHNRDELPLLEKAARTADAVESDARSMAADLEDAGEHHASRTGVIANAIATLGAMREAMGNAAEAAQEADGVVVMARSLTQQRNDAIARPTRVSATTTNLAEHAVTAYNESSVESHEATANYVQAVSADDPINNEPTQSASLHEQSVEENAGLAVNLVHAVDAITSRLQSLSQTTTNEIAGETGLNEVLSELSLLQSDLESAQGRAGGVLERLRAIQESDPSIASAISRAQEASEALTIPAKTIAENAGLDRAQVETVITKAEERRDAL